MACFVIPVSVKDVMFAILDTLRGGPWTICKVNQRFVEFKQTVVVLVVLVLVLLMEMSLCLAESKELLLQHPKPFEMAS